MNKAHLGIATLGASLIACILSSARAAQGTFPGDATRGKAVFQTWCTGCHTLDSDDEGPRLRGVYGRTSGTIPRFPYSHALKKARIVWNGKSLEKWLANPEVMVPGSGMPVSVTDPKERRDLIAYLKANSK